MSHPAENAMKSFLAALPASEESAWLPTHANDKKIRLTREPFRDGTVVTASVGASGVTIRSAGGPAIPVARRKMTFVNTPGATAAVIRLRSVHDGLVHAR
jgi:hypothetical protein